MSIVLPKASVNCHSRLVSRTLYCLQRVCFPALPCALHYVCPAKKPRPPPSPWGQGWKFPGGAIDRDTRKALRGASTAAFLQCPWATHQSGLAFTAALIHPGLTLTFFLFTYVPLFLIEIISSHPLMSLDRLIKCFIKALKRDSSANYESGSVFSLSQHRNKGHVGLNLRNEAQT